MDIGSCRVIIFMDVNIRYLTEDFDIFCFILKVTPFKGSHTGYLIYKTIHNKMSSFSMKTQILLLLLK